MTSQMLLTEYAAIGQEVSRCCIFFYGPFRRHHGKVTMQNKTVWIGLLAAAILCSCAVQEDIYTLDHRLSALERHNLELEKQNRELAKLNRDLLAANEKVEGLDQTRRDEEMDLREQYAGLSAQLQSLREETQLLSGRLEEMEYLLNQKLKGFEDNQLNNLERMDQLTTATAAEKKRIDNIERYLNLESAPVQKPASSAAAPMAAAAPASDLALYQEAKKKFDGGDLESARQDFAKLIASDPKSEHADNSQFWIAETYYQEKWYEKAILEYQKVIETYPTGNKVPAALLKQGLSFLKIGETGNARLVLKELIAKHPDTNEASIAKQKLETL